MQATADRLRDMIFTHEPDERILAFAREAGGYTRYADPLSAAADADVIYTDVWSSMGMEGEAEARRAVFQDYQVNAALMAVAKPDAMVQHCLPAHKGEEITREVFEAHADEIFDEAENRLHVQKAVLVKLMKP